jgi:hypothetical protein
LDVPSGCAQRWREDGGGRAPIAARVLRPEPCGVVPWQRAHGLLAGCVRLQEAGCHGHVRCQGQRPLWHRAALLHYLGALKLPAAARMLVPYVPVQVFFYRAEIFQGRIILGDKYEEYRWVTRVRSLLTHCSVAIDCVLHSLLYAAASTGC